MATADEIMIMIKNKDKIFLGLEILNFSFSDLIRINPERGTRNKKTSGSLGSIVSCTNFQILFCNIVLSEIISALSVNCPEIFLPIFPINSI